MNLGSLFSIAIGASLGAWLRYGFGLMLNPIFPTLPLGTLFANLCGGLLMGLVIGGFPSYNALTPELRGTCQPFPNTRGEISM